MYNDLVTPFTSPVGSFPANGYGLYDMTGNLSNGAGIGTGTTPQFTRRIRAVHHQTKLMRIGVSGRFVWRLRQQRAVRVPRQLQPGNVSFLIGFRCARGP